MSTTLKALGDSPQQRVLWMAIFVPGLEGRRGLPIVVVGEPGTAKTSIIKRLSRMAGLPFEGVLGSLRSPMDYLGVPVPQRMVLTEATQHLASESDFEPELDDDFNVIGRGTLHPGTTFLYMHYAPAGFAVRAGIAQRSLLLFDEANTMAPSVQAAMLRVLFEGIVGEMELPKGTRMLLAMNKQEDTSGGWDISPALANRMGWLDWEEPELSKFSNYLIASAGNGSGAMPCEPIDPAEHEAEVDKLWEAAWARAVGEVNGFLQHKPDLLHKKPVAADAAKAWPSRRTWDMLTHALAGSYVFDLDASERMMACSAFVGAGAYGELFNWMKESDLPDYAALLDGSGVFEHESARPDRTAAVLTGCLPLLVPEKAERRNERTTQMWVLLKDLIEAHPDVVDLAVPTVQAMCDARLMIGEDIGYSVFAKLEPMMSAAGLMKKAS